MLLNRRLHLFLFYKLLITKEGRRMKKKVVSNVIKGMCVGGSMLIPGVSGGSMAMILGIYNELISAVSSFFKNKRNNIALLGTFGVGGIVGILLFAKPLLYLTDTYTFPMMYFFMGAVLGSIPMIYKQAEIKKISIRSVLYILVGFIIISLISFIPKELFDVDLSTGIMDYLLLVIAGVVSAVALVLPGISTSYMLLVLGMYEETMKAIDEFYLPYLIPLGIGLFIGIVFTTKILEKAMTSYSEAAYLIILGFVVGSVIQVFPGIPSGINIIISLFTLFIGYFLIRKLSNIT